MNPAKGFCLTQGFFTAIDFKSLLRWGLTAADLEDWASWAPHSECLGVEELYRVILDPQMLVASPCLGAAVLEVSSGPFPFHLSRLNRGTKG